ncbi:MAG: molybdenum cofactor biosynthesis protein MoaE [Phycisphaerales bacterium]|jgi:molybdopterin synthase catalytic subunit|nr:molybdenum cofactor biosynthesis protein MoaE [Phycisphaerales bacterium]
MTKPSNISIDFVSDAVDIDNASVLPRIGCGGECIFIGRTRPETNPKHGELVALQYDCYQDMAKKELHILAQEAIDRFQIRYVRVTHSIGKVAINEASVVIAVSSNHRDTAFSACRFMIDLLKQRIPIWKQEKWADSTTWSDGVLLDS